MRITAEMSLYPLHEGFVDDIRDFIAQLRGEPGLEVVSNQMSTQVRGEFEAVTGAIQRCLRAQLDRDDARVLVVKYLTADLDIGQPPVL